MPKRIDLIYENFGVKCVVFLVQIYVLKSLFVY